ncbi:MAG TPA: helix-turn-helix domain-containing protein [Syntrophomonadaceae bacterium]|nr:helix-turn-helix domain-containing protein [Syntrophomonadaceae bacterium]
MNLLTLEEVAEILSVHVVTIRRMIHSKKIRAFKIGKGWRINESDLMEFIEKSSNVEE